MSIEYRGTEYLGVTDDTREATVEKLFLRCEQNEKYIDSLPADVTVVDVPELMDIWGLEDMKVIGVSGTNGKTTTSALIYSLLLDLERGAAMQGTRGFFVNDERMAQKSMTTPSILQTLENMKIARESGADHFVMEVSSHAIAQNRIEGLKFALKVHTNVTRDHLDYHGTIEEYRRIKSLFFMDDSPKLINRDEEKSLRYNSSNAYSYGVEEPATFKVLAFSLTDGIRAVVRVFGEEETLWSPMMGLFNLYNIMAAVSAVSILTQEPLSRICEAVENFGGVGGRMESVSENPRIIVDFAHTDDGMLRVLDSLKEKDLVVVFGAGGDRDRSKRPAMGAVAGKYAKKIYLTSDNPRSENPEDIIEDILAGLRGKENVHIVPDRRRAIEMAIEGLEEGEILLVLGKGDESWQEIDGERYPFDDREVIREILSRDS
jgi:UDP-N-acetylmuramoyl-L-alanyl-D-glutamate--2,6-diaminopimelate ligase